MAHENPLDGMAVATLDHDNATTSYWLHNDSGHHDNGSHDMSHDDHHGGVHGVHVISWNLDYVLEPLIVSIFIFAAGSLKLGFHYASFLSSIIPESCLLIVTGTIFGAILSAFDVADRFQMHPRLFMLFLLPPIVLESAYSLNDRVFFEHIGSILIFAVIGTLLNFVFLGPTLYGISLSGAMGSLDITLSECLLFASFIVAVDPVAVLAIFQEVGVNNVLYFLVFGESLLNDAVTVVLSNMMKAFVEMESIPVHQILLGVASFFTVSLGGLLIGLIYGVFTALFTRCTSHVRVVEPLAVLVFAYMSYLTAELVHWSGIIAMIGCGLVQAEYSFHNISRKSRITVKYFMKMISSCNDCIIFLFLGIELVTTQYAWHTGFVLWSLFYCLLFRFLVVFGLSFFLNRFNAMSSIDLEEQFIMWYGGLRGAVCFALCDTIRDDFRHKDLFMTTTFFIILVTVFLQGSTIKPLVSLCRIRKKNEEKELIMQEICVKVNDHLMTGIEALVQHRGVNYLRTNITWVNDNYLRRWLQKDPMSVDERILAAYGKLVMKDYEDIIHKQYLHPGQTNQIDENGTEDGTTDVPVVPYDSSASDKRGSYGLKIQFHSSFDDNVQQPRLPVGRRDHAGAAFMRQRMRHRTKSLTDAIHRRKSINLDEPSAADVKTLLRRSALSPDALHRPYDRNLIHDDEIDIESLLAEKRRRAARMRRTTHRQYAFDTTGESPYLPPRRLFSASTAIPPTIREVPSQPRMASLGDVFVTENETKEKSSKPSALKITVSQESEDVFEQPQDSEQSDAAPTKPYFRKGEKPKSHSVDRVQQMSLLHNQDAIMLSSDSEQNSPSVSDAEVNL